MHPVREKTKCYKPPGESAPASCAPTAPYSRPGSSQGSEPCTHSHILQAEQEYFGRMDSRSQFPEWRSGVQFFRSVIAERKRTGRGRDDGTLYEFDGTISSQTNFNLGGNYSNSLMVLPPARFSSGAPKFIRSTEPTRPRGRPTITTYAVLRSRAAPTYQISGTQFNGLSQAGCFRR